jgi:hypothetical protein
MEYKILVGKSPPVKTRPFLAGLDHGKGVFVFGRSLTDLSEKKILVKRPSRPGADSSVVDSPWPIASYQAIPRLAIQVPSVPYMCAWKA